LHAKALAQADVDVDGVGVGVDVEVDVEVDGVRCRRSLRLKLLVKPLTLGYPFQNLRTGCRETKNREQRSTVVFSYDCDPSCCNVPTVQLCCNDLQLWAAAMIYSSTAMMYMILLCFIFVLNSICAQDIMMYR
jgi:hypothetical protein